MSCTSYSFVMTGNNLQTILIHLLMTNTSFVDFVSPTWFESLEISWQRVLELRIPSTSMGTVRTTPSDTTWPCRTTWRAALTDPISQALQKWGACGGSKWKGLFTLFSFSWTVNLREEKASCSSLFPPLKFVPWSPISSNGFPCCKMKQHGAIKMSLCPC